MDTGNNATEEGLENKYYQVTQRLTGEASLEPELI